MDQFARRTFAASLLVLPVIIGPAAFAAADSEQEKPAQTEPNSKSYLPPWMQGKGGSAPAGAEANAAAAPSGGAPASDNDAAKKKIKDASQGQRLYRRRPREDGFIGGFGGFFGF